MAKELPYFKFEPAEWLIGDINYCDYATQGIFINVCIHYWLTSGNITKTKLYNRFANAKQLLNICFEKQIIKEIDDKIVITFLDDQLNNILDISRKRSIAGSQGGRGIKANKKQKKANAKQLPIYKIREDKIREDINIDIYSNFSEEEITTYKKFIEWINKDNPKVAKLDPIQIDKFYILIDKYKKEKLIDVIKQMENKKDLNKKYTSAYLTALNWLKRNE